MFGPHSEECLCLPCVRDLMRPGHVRPAPVAGLAAGPDVLAGRMAVTPKATRPTVAPCYAGRAVLSDAGEWVTVEYFGPLTLTPTGRVSRAKSRRPRRSSNATAAPVTATKADAEAALAEYAERAQLARRTAGVIRMGELA